MSHQCIRWGILGPGSIANRFADGVASLPDAEITAVGSRDRDRAITFADRHHVPHRHGSYEALVEDPDVDVIYVATPHPFHAENSILALNAGKPVLCEKPFTLNARQAQQVIETARGKGLFLMEAMWSRFFPLMERVRGLVSSGAIGEVKQVHADFGFRAGFNPSSRLFDPALGGGALLDVGVYPVSFASMILGEPSGVTGLAHLCPTGVDDNAGMVLSYPQGQIAVLSTSVTANTPHEASIVGSAGQIRIHASWWRPERLTIKRDGQPDEGIAEPYESTGFNYEATEVGRCLRAGELESPIMPLDETLTIMRTLDTLRAQWGIKYPSE